MPLGLKRFHESKQTHFINFTCYRRLRHLKSPEARDIVVAMLEQTRQRYGFRVYGFVVMPEHIHLLISEPDRGTIANAIQSLKIASSKRTAAFRKMDEIRSPLWQKRYFDLNIKDSEQFVEKLKYIHRNPVERVLCERPEDWQWSSFDHYASGSDCGVEIESRWTAARRNKKKLGQS